MKRAQVVVLRAHARWISSACHGCLSYRGLPDNVSRSTASRRRRLQETVRSFGLSASAGPGSSKAPIFPSKPLTPKGESSDGKTESDQHPMSKSDSLVRLSFVGNVVIASAKFVAYLHSGSSAMLSECIHSVVDCGNQALLLVGLRTAAAAPDRHHQYGYGKSIYFWSLVSALGTFWLGAGVSLRNSFQDLLNPNIQLEDVTWDIWSVLGVSFLVDGAVLRQSLKLLETRKPKDMSILEYLRRIRDPTSLAVVLEDSAACLGVLIAIAGIGVSQYTGSPLFDSIAGVGISSLLAGMGLALARLNERYLLGQAVDSEIVDGIKKLLLDRPAIDNVQSVQSQWTSPFTFAYKAEVDFDGTYLAAKLMDRYEGEFISSSELEDDLPVLLAFYAEDVVRTLEREVRECEREIRSRYPEAQFIELEPASKDTTAFAIDGHREKLLREIESATLDKFCVWIANASVRSRQAQKRKDAQKDGKGTDGGPAPPSAR